MSGGQAFTTTHWTVVLQAGQNDSPQAATALEQLCRTYWYPLYAYVRRRGYSPEDAQDLTQEFFARLLAKEGLRHVNPVKGKFRSFLLASINHMLADERDRANRQKRGGGQTVISFDAWSAEERYRLEPADIITPERMFDRHWALTLIKHVLTRLEQEYTEAGKAHLFSILKECLINGKGGRDYANAARQLHMSEGAIRVALHRLRQRFGELFRVEVANTLSNFEEIDVEMHHLLASLTT